MLTIILFYFFSFWFGFLLCIPIGPVNLEVFNTALKKQYPQAVAVALGGALGDAIWAITAFFGVTPFQTPKMEGFFFIATALITGVLGFLAIKDSKFIGKKEDGMVHKIKRKRWAFLKGLTMVMVNPLGVVSWMICLQFLKKTGFYIPLELRYEIIFFLVVTIGATTYFSLIVFITNKMKHIFNPARAGKITKYLGYLLLALSAYFLYHAGGAFFFNPSYPS